MVPNSSKFKRRLTIVAHDIAEALHRGDHWTEEEVRHKLSEHNVFQALGYDGVGKDITMERRQVGRSKRYDFRCEGSQKETSIIVEVKKPERAEALKSHQKQLEEYIRDWGSLRGVIFDGLRLILYKRHLGALIEDPLSTKNILSFSDDDWKKVFVAMQKQQIDIKKPSDIQNYANQMKEQSLHMSLAKETGRVKFQQDFDLTPESPFGSLVRATISLFDAILNEEIEGNKFLSGAFKFWEESYARKPDPIPKSWKFVMEKIGLKEKDINKFMFCIETSYSILARLILAKACEDNEFPGVELEAEFIYRVHKNQGVILPSAWGFVVHKLMTNLGENLVESVFEQDIFFWWNQPFINEPTNSLIESLDSKPSINNFGTAVASLSLRLLQYDFSKIKEDIKEDPLGTLYQSYFDTETRRALGEFYTPKEIVRYLLDMIDYKSHSTKDRIIDPACGSGTFLVEALKIWLRKQQRNAKKDGWRVVLSDLCNGYKIVGFDIHPFAVVMAQIHFMMYLINPYKMAIDEARKEHTSFTLKRIPIFRTDSLEREVTQKQRSISEIGKSNSISIRIPVKLPMREPSGKFVEKWIEIPSIKELSNAGLGSREDYFQALQAIFDCIKFSVRKDEPSFKIDINIISPYIDDYLPGKRTPLLDAILEKYANTYLNLLDQLSKQYEDGRLIKSIEDVVFAALLKTEKYAYVVGNPPYIRIQTHKGSKYPNYETYKSHSSADIYQYFIELGIYLLKSKGKMGYIVSDRFSILETGYGTRRNIMENGKILSWVDCRHVQVFKEALNYPLIWTFQKEKAELKHIIKCFRFFEDPAITETKVLNKVKSAFKDVESEHDHKWLSIRKLEFGDVFGFPQNLLTSEPWIIMPKEELRVFNFLKRKGKQLLSLSSTEKQSSAVFEGSSTGDKKIYVGRVVMATKDLVQFKPLDKKLNSVAIEKDILKIYVEETHKWLFIDEGMRLIFPYIYDERLTKRFKSTGYRPYTQNELIKS